MSRSSIWRRAQFGVGSKLRFGFSVVGGLTVISTAASLLSFSVIEAGLGDFAVRQMPIVTGATQLSAISGEISVAATRLINARTASDQKRIAALIAHKRGDLGESLRRRPTLDIANAPVGKFFTPSQRLNAAFFELPRALKWQLAQIGFDTLVLPPIGHSRFCLRYPGDCAVHGADFRRRNIALTPERWIELNIVNRQVNRDIIPELTIGNGATEEWLISPPAGDCKDYAVTKRHELLALGWPSRALLLSEVVVPSGQHHLVLVVRTKDVDLVLDNLNANIRSVAMTYRQYEWVRIETPQNPKFWARVRTPGTLQTAMISH